MRNSNDTASVKNTEGTLKPENNSLLSVDEIRKAFACVDEAGVKREEIILVGGTVMELLGLRKSGDVDLILTPDARRKLEATNPGRTRGAFDAINLGENTQVLKDPYRSIGVSDEECFDRPLYTLCEIPGLGSTKIARAELEFGKKLFRSRDKDRNDTALLLEHASRSNGWNWELIPVSAVKTMKHGKGKEAFGRRIDAVLRKLFWVTRHPLRASPKVLTKFRNGIGRQQHKILSPAKLSVQQLDTGTLVQLQFHGGRFRRYDTLVRLETMASYLALQRVTGDKAPLSLFAPDHKVFSEYNRMQDLRVGRESAIRFQEFVASIERKGFHSDRYPITLDGDGRLKDGSHRFAAALHYGIERVPVRFVPGKKGPVDYGREWFENHGFPEDYLKRLDNRLRNNLIATGAAFELIVWPPAMPFEHEIFETLAEQYSVIAEIRNINLQDFPEFVEAMYLSDDIEQWKIQKKIYHMRQYKPLVSVFSFLIDDPRYRVKTRTESYLSDAVAKLKAEIRNRYKVRIEGYVHDIITHIGDNPAMNRDMVKTLNRFGCQYP